MDSTECRRDARELRPPLWADLRPGGLLRALADPPDRYRPVPWLAWTGTLDWPVLRAQLADMRDKGITEFFLFPIYGMELPYMSAAYWERVGQTLTFCREYGMKCWIYDEYNWPSGVCAGQVLRDYPQYAAKHLWLRPATDDDGWGPPPEVGPLQRCGCVDWAVAGDRGVRINVRGCDWLSTIPGYLDVLNPQACARFIQSTHDRYHQRFADAFPDTIPGFFTDEPAMHGGVADGGALLVPYTDDLFDAFEARYGYDLRQRLDDLATDSPTARRTRCHYWRWVAERFGEAYGAQQRAWCDAHGVALTGHALGEEFLHNQVCHNGDVWELLRHFTIPGIDMLANADGFTYPHRIGFYGDTDRRAFHLTCKLVHAVVRHCGGREMLSEAFGVCDWGTTLFRQKRGFHYQVALGVTLFNDNSLVTSLADFRKHAISGKHFTQPWWTHYRQYADYNARLAALHAEGEPVAEVAVLYPRSTMWARCGGDARAALKPLESLLYDLLDELIRGQWPFDFVFEPVLAEARIEGDQLVTPHARYRALVVPCASDLPRECADVLRAFAEAGGIVVFAGDLPEREVESQSDLSAQVGGLLTCARARHVAPTGAAVCGVLDAHLKRPLVLDGDGAREFVSSWRRLAGHDVLFVANMAETSVDVEVTVNLDGPLVVCDPDTLACYRPAGHRFGWHFEPWQGYLFIVGEAVRAAGDDLPAGPVWLAPERVEVLDGPWEFHIEPGNVLRLTTQVRPDPDNSGAARGWQHDRGEAGWITPVERRLPEPILPGESPWYWTRARVVCESGALPRRIVADNPDFLEVFVNGRAAESVVGDPVWTEENVHFDVADLFVEGENWVHVRARTSKYNDPRVAPMGGIANLVQPVVLVGEFRVEDPDRLVPWTGRLRADAPWEDQGLPHVAGVGICRRTINVAAPEGTLLHLPGCADSVEVRVNGESCGVRAWPPYVFRLDEHLRPGDNDLEIRVHNTLGHLILETYGGRTADEEPTSGLVAAPRLLHVDGQAPGKDKR